MSRARTVAAAAAFLVVKVWRPAAVALGVFVIIHGLDLWSHPAALCGAGGALIAVASLNRQKRRLR